MLKCISSLWKCLSNLDNCLGQSVLMFQNTCWNLTFTCPRRLRTSLCSTLHRTVGRKNKPVAHKTPHTLTNIQCISHTKKKKICSIYHSITTIFLTETKTLLRHGIFGLPVLSHPWPFHSVFERRQVAVFNDLQIFEERMCVIEWYIQESWFHFLWDTLYSVFLKKGNQSSKVKYFQGCTIYSSKLHTAIRSNSSALIWHLACIIIVTDQQLGSFEGEGYKIHFFQVLGFIDFYFFFTCNTAHLISIKCYPLS